MKRSCAFVMCCILLFNFSACTINKISEEDTGEKETVAFPTSMHHDLITDAILIMKVHWATLYSSSRVETDRYFEIKNTRVITIKENDIEFLRDIAYIVEFEIYSDYFGSAPYYTDIGTHDTVVVYKNGTMEASSNLIQRFRAIYYNNDFSEFIESIDDYHGEYNCIETL